MCPGSSLREFCETCIMTDRRKQQPRRGKNETIPISFASASHQLCISFAIMLLSESLMRLSLKAFCQDTDFDIRFWSLRINRQKVDKQNVISSGHWKVSILSILFSGLCLVPPFASEHAGWMKMSCRQNFALHHFGLGVYP